MDSVDELQTARVVDSAVPSQFSDCCVTSRASRIADSSPSSVAAKSIANIAEFFHKAKFCKFKPTLKIQNESDKRKSSKKNQKRQLKRRVDEGKKEDVFIEGLVATESEVEGEEVEKSYSDENLVEFQAKQTLHNVTVHPRSQLKVREKRKKLHSEYIYDRWSDGEDDHHIDLDSEYFFNASRFVNTEPFVRGKEALPASCNSKLRGISGDLYLPKETQGLNTDRDECDEIKAFKKDAELLENQVIDNLLSDPITTADTTFLYSNQSAPTGLLPFIH